MRDLVFAFGASVLIVFSAASAREFLNNSSNPSLKEPILEETDFGLAPSFKFVDQTGQTFSSDSIKGPWLFNVFFTRCNGPCPMTLQNLMNLSEELGEDHPLQIVSLSVDPDYDSSEKLQEYAKANNLKLPRWRFLSGKLDDVNSVIENGFKLGAMDDPRMHTTRVVLVDSENKIRGYALGAESDSYENLLEKVKREYSN
jgi:protein SCO1/2